MTTKCAGLNCGTTTGDHSPECRAEHAAAMAGEQRANALKLACAAKESLHGLGNKLNHAEASYEWCEEAKAPYIKRGVAAIDALVDIVTAPPAASGQKLTDEQISTVIDEWYFHADEPVKEKLASFARAILSYSATASDKEGA